MLRCKWLMRLVNAAWWYCWRREWYRAANVIANVQDALVWCELWPWQSPGPLRMRGQEGE